MEVRADNNHWRIARWPARVVRFTGLLSIVLSALLPIAGVAQDTPCPTGTPHLISAPSLPVRGPMVRSTPIPPGAMVPTPGTEFPQHEHLVGIVIAGFPFLMHPGPCAHRVEAAILAHDDLFTGNMECDVLIRQARTIQRQKEREDPCYANEPRIRPGDDSWQSIFERRYAAMRAAMAARDEKAIGNILAPDFVSEDASGRKKDIEEMIPEVVALPKDPQQISQTSILSIKVNDNTAVVNQRYDMKTTKSAPDGSKLDVELITVSTDTWTALTGGWFLQRTVTNQLDYFVNGHHVAHRVRPSAQ